MRKVNVDVESLSMSSNYFELLGVQQDFDIDKDLLHKNYIKLQQLLHPDKSINKPNSEKILVMEKSSHVNEVYNILNNDKKRAEYLLLLKDIVINQEESNVQPDPGMLMEMLEINENPEGYNIAKMKLDCIEKFKESYAKGLFELSAKEIIRLQYLDSLRI
jgi:Fe-S protein assembly co-chaperone HscB